GQTDIEEDDFRFKFGDGGQGRQSIVGQGDFVAFQPQNHGQAGCRVQVIVHDQYAAVWRRYSAGQNLGRTGLCRVTGQRWHTNPEHAPLPCSSAGRLDRAAVQLDEPPGQCQPDAQASLRSIQGLIALGEKVKDVWQQIGRYADPPVDDFQLDLPGPLFERQP